jgi:hypothetical protein
VHTSPAWKKEETEGGEFRSSFVEIIARFEAPQPDQIEALG